MPLWLGPALEALQPADSFSKFRMGMTALGHGADAPDDAARSASAPAESSPFSLGPFVAA